MSRIFHENGIMDNMTRRWIYGHNLTRRWNNGQNIVRRWKNGPKMKEDELIDRIWH